MGSMAAELMETLSVATSPDHFESGGSQPLPLAESAALRTGPTLDDIAHPAYMLTCNFELNWYNEAAREQVLGFDVVPPGTESRNIFHILAATDRRAASARDELIRLYVALSKSRVSRTALVMMAAKLGEDAIQLINDCYDKSGDGTRKMVVDFPCRIDGSDGKAAAWRVYGIYFREGILIIHVPDGETDPNVLEFISRRNIVVHDLMRKQMPAYTAFIELTAELRNAVKLRAELPLDEYFGLINEIWSAMAPVCRQHFGTGGKHVGDGIQYVFLPQSDANYAANAEACARDLNRAMTAISNRWQLRKPGCDELVLDVELRERQQWLGVRSSETYSPATQNYRASRLAEPGSADALRVIKVLGSKLMAQERARATPVFLKSD
ncbi:MAG: hypothetical protein JWN94_2229 [Betaproteobacteria bacterium]|nr:hypothetical protein [Betaproteobacteria bacterium]